MKIVLASTSAVKLDAVKNAFAHIADAEIVPVKVPSNVNEQPIDHETIRGAFNRITAARKAIPNGDLYVSIENGIFRENGAYVDKAIVVTCNSRSSYTFETSDGVVFPDTAVEETRARGFNVWTVRKVMEEQHLVDKHDDPHLSLSGKPRAAYIQDALGKTLQQLRL